MNEILHPHTPGKVVVTKDTNSGPRIPATDDMVLPTVFKGQEKTGAKSRYAHAIPERLIPNSACAITRKENAVYFSVANPHATRKIVTKENDDICAVCLTE